MPESTMLATIKMLLEISSEDQTRDQAIEYYIDAAKKRISNMCLFLVKDFPEDLDHVVVEMVTQKFGNASAEGVTSIKRGDTSMSFDTSDAFQRVLLRYEDELARFRQVRGSCSWEEE